MATEEEAREAADGKEVQMEDVDLEPFHMQTRLDSKLSSMEIKNVAESIDSTEGTLKIPEDQVLVDAPSEIKHPLEHNLNGTSSSLNGHMDEENKISNEQLQGDSKKDREQVQAALGGESTDQNNKINKEANDYLNHGETTTEDSSLLKHENKDKEPMPDTLKTNSDIDQSKLVVDQHQLDHNMDPAKATEDTQPASMENIPNAEVVTEARAEVQSPLYPNLDDSNAILDTVDGSTETDEAATGDAAHLEHRKRFPEDTSTDKHTEVMVKEEDQQSKQAGAINADAVQEDIPKCEESGVSKEMPKSEHADESMTDAQEVLHQEPSEDTNGLAYEKREQTSQQSSMAASGDTTSEPPVDIQVQNKKSLEEMKDADAVDTEAAMQERYIAFEEGTPESHVAATEQDSVETNNTESVETHTLKIVPSSEEEKVEHDVTARGSSTSSQEVDNVVSTEAIMDKVAENIVEVTNAATVDEAKKEKNMPGIESEVTKSTEPVDTEEDSDQRYFSLLDNSAQGDDTSVSEKKHTGSALEKNEIEATRTESVTGESKASVSEEPSPQDYVTESEATSDSKEVNTTESSEAIEGDKDIKTREILDQNSMNSAGKSTQENNAPESELTSQIQPEELESEEMKVNELVQVNESSPEISATVFHKEIQENNPATSELHVMESGGMRNIETTEVQVTPHQLNCDHPEEKTTEETITSSEPQTLEPESVKKMNDIEASKPQDISQQSIISPSEKSVPEEIAKEDIVTIESNDGHQQPEDPESAELDEIKTNKSQEIASSSIVFNYEEPTSQDDVTVTEPNSETQAENLLSAEVMEDTENVKGHGALSGEVAKEENVETETIADMSPVQEPELEEAKNTEPVGTEDNITPTELPAERMEKETVEIEAIPYESRVASIRDVAENDILTAITSHADIQPVLKQESVEDKCIDTTEKPRETQQIVSSPSDELIPAENKMAMTEPACETPLQNVIAQGIKDCEDAPTDQISNLDSFPTPGEADQENKLPGIEPTSDDQELGSTEQTIGIEAMETEDHQQHRVFTLEETAVNKKSNVDDHQVHEEKLDNEAMEVESVLEQSNISTPYNAHEDRSELGTDPDCCVQQAEQVESSKDSEESKHLKEEDTSDQKIVTLDDTATEGIVQDEISPPAGMEKEHEPKSLETSDVQEVQELGSIEQTRGVEATETEDHQQYIVSTLEESALDNNPNVDDHQVHEEKPAELKDNEAMEAEPVLEQSNISTPDNAPAQQVESSKDSEESKHLKEEETSDQTIITLEDTATKDTVKDEIDLPVGMEQEHKQKTLETSDVQEVQDLGSIEETRGIEATETEDHQQHRFSTLDEPEVDKKPNVDDHQVHEEKPAELIDNGAMEAEPVLEQSNISTTDNPPEERSELGTDPYCCVQPAQQVESSKDSEESKRLNEEETSDQEIITLEDTTTEDIVQDEINPPADMEQEHEPKSLETSDVQEVQELDSIEETRGVEATEIEDHQQHRVSTLEESAVDKPNVDDHQVHEEKPAELKDNEAMEAEPVLEQSNISTPDNAPAQQVESSKDSEESKHLKEEETSDQTIITLEDTATKDTVKDEIDLPVGMEQEHERKSLETSDVQEVQDLGSIEQNRGTEATETEDHQQHRVSTLEEPAVDKKPNVDDHQVHDEKPAELKDNEAMEAEPVLEQSNISTSDNAPEERSELGTDPDCCVHPAQQVESSRDSEDSKLLKEEETSDQKIITLEDTGTVGIVEDEFDPPVSMEQEHEQKSVEEVKDINANEAKEDFHTNQPDALDKLASESNTATAEPTYDIQHLDDFETKETKSIEGIDDGDISCQQAGVATSVDPSPTDNEIAQEHPVESHEENLGNETENEMLDRGMKEEIHRSAEPKDDAFHLGETIPTTKKSKNLADEDVIQSSGEDTLESSNGTDQIKGGKKAGIEHNSSQKPSEHHGENITHVQDKDINRESVTERGTTEISQALIGNDAQASQDVTEEDGTTKSGEQTNDHRQAGDVEHRPQTCESSVDDEDVQKVSFDERHKEDEEVETQKEQLQADEQKHKDESDDASNEPLVESKNTNNGTTNRTRETDMLEAGQSLRTSEDSTPSITNTPVEDITGTDKGVEDENWPNSTNTSDADAKMEKQEDQENTGKDNIVPMDSTRGQDETTDEITNEELEPSLASCVQDISHTSPSKDHILENDPTAVPYNVGSGGHEDKECTNKVNDDLPAIQELEKEIVTGMQENKEMQNETKGAHHVESHTKAEVEDMFQLHSNEPYNVDTKIDDTVHNTTVQPRETEEIGENKGFSSIYKPVVETSEQNNVEQDLSIQHKNQVEDEKLESTEDNAVEMEATQQKVDTSNVDISNDDQLSTSNALTKHETESADDVLQLETEGNTFELCEKTEASNTSVLETVTLTEEICDKVTEVEGGLSDESLKTFDDARRNLDVSSVVRETNEESMNQDMEENKLAAPEHPTMDETTPKQQISVSEKPLPIEPEEPDDQIHKKQDEKDMYEPNFGDDQKEVEQDLPVSNFLMNLILGKENSNANGHSEPEAETKQEETRDDNSCSIIPKQEESLVLPPTENNMECKLTVEQEQKDVKCPEEKYEAVEEQSHDLKLGTETSLETDAEFNKNSHHLELPPYQDKMQDEISNEILSEEPAEAFAKIEAKDLAIPSIIQDDKEVDNVCQENTEAATQNEIRSIKNNLDDFKNTKISEEDTPGEGETGLLPECLNEARSVNSVSEQTLLLTDSGMTDAKSLPSPNPVCEIQDKTIESSSIGATSIPDIQVESEEDKIEKKQPTTTATGDVAEEHVEISNDNPQKSIGPETTSNEQEPQIAQQVNDTEIVLGHEKKILAGSSSTFMDKKEDSNFSVKEGNNIQTAVEIQADGPNMQVNQDKQEAADIKNETESEKLKESNIQEKQGNDTEEKSPKECHEEDQQFLVKEEIGVKEEDVHQTVQSHTETVKIKANDEQKLSDSEVQERDFNVFSPKDVREPDESFVDTANPECRTDEEQSPKADESNISEQKTYEGKTKDEEKIKSFTDEEMKTEAQVTGEKAAHKKQNLLSGVGSKVKHQLAKVKKAITGKPGHTKPKSPKA